ncbi:hypothetical protein COLO4_00144 [Corchorus olitorius]|uniref:Uncharacterized protein n=1 Tax=Corchorus olitorius TaxID=93759 RepID=A0A1R3L4K1_9ROSI|nr:hypothetical protein COLO4_00144 [Corchorus olitorius]
MNPWPNISRALNRRAYSEGPTTPGKFVIRGLQPPLKGHFDPRQKSIVL